MVDRRPARSSVDADGVQVSSGPPPGSADTTLVSADPGNAAGRQRGAARAARWPGGAPHWSLRARLTVVATALLGVGIAAGAALLVVTGARTLQAAVDSGALQSAREVAALVDSKRLPDPVPQGGEGTAAIQVVDAQNRVRAASTGTDRLVPVLRPAEVAAVRSGQRLVVPGSRLGLSGPLRVVGVPAGRPSDPQTVVVAVDFGGARSGTRVLLVGLAVGAPLLLAVVALAMWWVTGRALRPVEQLRRGALAITGPGRLPVPPAQDEIRRLAETLNDMLARLDAAGARQRAFVSDAAHELRSPLASARTQLEVAAAVDAGTPAGELATDVLVDVERLGRLVDDLLLLARLDEAPRRPRAPLDLYALADDVVGRYAAARVPVALEPCDGRLHGAGRGRRGPAGAGQPGRQRGPARPVPGDGHGRGGHGDRGRRRAGHPARRPGPRVRPVHPARLGPRPGVRRRRARSGDRPRAGRCARWLGHSRRRRSRSGRHRPFPGPADGPDGCPYAAHGDHPLTGRALDGQPADGFAASGLPNQDYQGTNGESGGRGEASPALWWGLRRRGGIGTGGLKHRAQPPRFRCPPTSVSPVRPLPDYR